MKSGIKYICLSGLALLFLVACSQQEWKDEPEDDIASIGLTVSKESLTRASSVIGTPTSNVNRILVLPFQKLNNAPDNGANNFIPAWNFARQWDISSFPAQSLTIGLPKTFTYKVMVIGYNQNDYNYYQPNTSSNRVEISNTQPASTTLANFRLYPKLPNEVPEFFTCFLTASQGGNPIGTIFTPTDASNISLSGQLNRIVSGLTVTVTNIPGFVKSVTLVAERMVKAIQVNDTIASVIQTNGDNESRVIRKLIPSAGTVSFSEYLLPTKTTYSTLLYLDIEYDSIVERYQIKVPNSAVSQNNSIFFLPNDVVSITGDYSSINLGFEINCNINLDDDRWDGI